MTSMSAPQFSLTAQCASRAKGVAAQTPTHLFINEGLDSSGRRKKTAAAPQDRSAIYSHVQRFRPRHGTQTRPVSAGRFVNSAARGVIFYHHARPETLGSCKRRCRGIV